MKEAGMRTRLLDLSGKIVPYILGFSFVFSYYTNWGTIALLAIASWYIALNWKAVLGNRWALVVMALFAAIAAKDGIMFVLGEGTFRAFAKSGSRVFMLLGSSALVLAYERERIEKAFLIALGITFIVMGGLFIAMRVGLVPWIFNTNAFGMLGVWFPLAGASMLRRRGGRKAFAAAIGVLIIGFAIFVLDVFVKIPGSRTAPLAYLCGAVFVLAPRRPRILTGIAGAAVVVLAAIFIVVLSLVYVPRIDDLLAQRQQIWGAFAQKAAERPLVGWGFTEEEDNRRLVGELLEGKHVHYSFMLKGLGPHNSFLAMLFENGAIAAVLFLSLLLFRAFRMSSPPGPFDVSLMTYIAFMSTDAMNPGGLTFLGFYLGVCILAFYHAEPDRSFLNGKMR